MNEQLQLLYTQLSTAERNELRRRLSESPKSILLLDILQQKGSNALNTAEAVDLLYNDNEVPFATRRNRFFKLRTELMKLMQSHTPGSVSALLPLEEQLINCRQLVTVKQFGLASVDLRKLIEICTHNNIFELLPEAYLLLIQCTQSINLLHETPELVAKLKQISSVLDSFRQMQGLGRIAYYHSLQNNAKKVTDAVEQMRSIMQNNNNWPRFKLFYHFSAFNYRVAHADSDTRSVMHHLQQVRKFAAANPDMPCQNYEKHGAIQLEQYLINGEATFLFQRGKHKASYQKFCDLWAIQEKIPELRTARTDSYFNNRITIEMACGKMRDALKTAESYINFLNKQNNEARRFMGYTVLANLYTYSWPKHPAPDSDFLIRELGTYIRLLQKTKTADPTNIQATQAIFAFQNKKWSLARKIILQESVQQFMQQSGLGIYNRILLLNPSSPPQLIQKLIAELEREKNKSHIPQIAFANERALQMLLMIRNS
ncbi:MAG: hypothetical protein ACK5Z2_02935 [Bacteroidota bacterium]|jgi:hypothetical protein